MENPWLALYGSWKMSWLNAVPRIDNNNNKSKAKCKGIKIAVKNGMKSWQISCGECSLVDHLRTIIIDGDCCIKMSVMYNKLGSLPAMQWTIIMITKGRTTTTRMAAIVPPILLSDGHHTPGYMGIVVFDIINHKIGMIWDECQVGRKAVFMIMMYPCTCTDI